MAFDAGLAERCRELLVDLPDVEEKALFGGLGYLLHGNLACGVHADRLIVRVGPEKHQEFLSQDHVLPFDITGRAMTGWLFVEAAGLEDDEVLRTWVQTGLLFAESLPPK